jgi:hypothetical protein
MQSGFTFLKGKNKCQVIKNKVRISRLRRECDITVKKKQKQPNPNQKLKNKFPNHTYQTIINFTILFTRFFPSFWGEKESFLIKFFKK